jgi:LPXTG-motif cell wall-anchored protein
VSPPGPTAQPPVTGRPIGAPAPGLRTLAFTGADAMPVALLGAALLGAGLVLRRRQRAS